MLQHGQGLLLASGGGGGRSRGRCRTPYNAQDKPSRRMSRLPRSRTPAPVVLSLGDTADPFGGFNNPNTQAAPSPQPFTSGSLGVGPQCQVFLKACQMVPMCSQDLSKPLILGASAPFVGPRGRRTKPIRVVQSTATLWYFTEPKARTLVHPILAQRCTDESLVRGSGGPVR